MSDIPEDILAKAEGILHAFIDSWVDDKLTIARALMEAEARGMEKMYAEAARAVKLCGDPSLPEEADKLARWCQANFDRTCLSGAAGLAFLEAIRAGGKND